MSVVGCRNVTIVDAGTLWSVVIGFVVAFAFYRLRLRVGRRERRQDFAGRLQIAASRVLLECDPIAYRCTHADLAGEIACDCGA
ncbi:hypothetical protein [Agromyces binzhouensis]|uniref:Uncharacterized protein n=1 Tax=Agromyces binzhouensis TaxID=1817495 RepID=A0A4Q2JJB9_9MICO|nr:hypothetical protein [Agromyces binzhouensis]RXZ46874.1 hypothetical protein ESO86_10525 [Agromyces binzhouensis]